MCNLTRYLSHILYAARRANCSRLSLFKLRRGERNDINLFTKGISILGEPFRRKIFEYNSPVIKTRRSVTCPWKARTAFIVLGVLSKDPSTFPLKVKSRVIGDYISGRQPSRSGQASDDMLYNLLSASIHSC